MNGESKKRTVMAGILITIAAILYRTVMAKVLFLQADEEIFSYNAYLFELGRSFEFMTGRIGAYIGYPFLLSIWFRIFGTSFFSARMFSVVCMGIVVLFAYMTLLKITENWKISVAGSLLLAVLPFPLRYGNMVLSEPLAWAFISISAYVLVLALKDQKWYLFLISGFVAAPAVAVRRSALILPLVLFPALIWINRSSLKRILKEAFPWLGGFLIPAAGGFIAFVVHFGWSKLEELRFFRAPEFTVGSTFENVFYTLHPVSWKGAALAIFLLFGCAVLLMSLFRDRWKIAFASAFLWAAFMRIALGTEGLSDQEMARLMVIPVVVLFAKGMYAGKWQLYASITILFGSAVAFSTLTLTGDIWNVVIYSSAGALMLLYLNDRLDSRLLGYALLAGGMVLLVIVSEKEPQIRDIVLTILPVAGVCFSYSIPSVKNPGMGIPVTMVSMVFPLLWFSDAPLHAFAGGLIVVSLAAVLVYSIRVGKKWSVIRYIPVLASLGFIFLLPDEIPAWGVYLPILGIVIFDLAPLLRFGILKRVGDFMPVTGFFLAFLLAWIGTGDPILSLFSAVMVGAASSAIVNANSLASVWKEKVGERISLPLIMLVVGYLAFYVYYAWTEVYLTEFLLQATLIGGLLLWVLAGKGNGVDSGRSPGKGMIGRIAKKYGPVNRPSVAIFLLIIVISLPISVNAYHESDWFVEEPMDQRPYMRTIEGVANWIVENTEEGEFVLVWHCYAVEADRETIIMTSNARRYDGRALIEEMESSGVDLFVRDYYTDIGIWSGQPHFQRYIRSNFHIDRVIDGNECWIRNDADG